MKKTLVLSLTAAVLLSGCTSITVKPAPQSEALNRICIENNPKVTIKDFLPVVREGFQRHGLSTEVFDGAKPAGCDAVLTYTALRSWDFAPYLSVAELNLHKNDQLIASAEYHLKLKGGFSLMKWQGVKTKMTPVIDQLLAEYKKS